MHLHAHTHTYTITRIYMPKTVCEESTGSLIIYLLESCLHAGAYLRAQDEINGSVKLWQCNLLLKRQNSYCRQWGPHCKVFIPMLVMLLYKQRIYFWLSFLLWLGALIVNSMYFMGHRLCGSGTDRNVKDIGLSSSFIVMTKYRYFYSYYVSEDSCLLGR